MASGAQPTVAAVIPTFNAAALLPGCLESVAWADEIHVVDLHSTDETAAICARFPQCRLHDQDGFAFARVNYGIDQATTDWVIRIDSDERVTPELAAEMRDFMRSAPADVTGLACWERLVILGREMRHGRGARHHRKLLFRRGAARYAVQYEHEDLTSTGRWVDSTSGYMHLNYPTVADYLRKTNDYTTLDADREAPVPPPAAMRVIRDLLRPMYIYYLRQRGYRDGWIGFVDAAMMSVYQLTFWAKRRERWEARG